MANQIQAAPAAQIPQFFRDIREILRDVNTNEAGIYTFPPVIEDMFITLGIYSRNADGTPVADVAEVNAEKYHQVRTLRGIINAILAGNFARDAENNVFDVRVHQEPQILDRFGAINIERANFRDLITTYEANYAEAGDFISKLLIFLSRVYEDQGFLNNLAGRYPFKVIFSVDPTITVNALVNNQAELKTLLLESFFRMLGTADFIYQTRGGGIDYAQADNWQGDGDRNIDEINGVPVNYEAQNVNPDEIVLNRIRGANISLTMLQYSRLVQGRNMPPQLRLPVKISRSVINPNNSDSYCLIYSLIIASKIMNNPEVYKKITNKTSLNKLEAFPIIQQTFDDLFDSFSELYNEEEYLEISAENLETLEILFNININVYTIVDNEASKIDIVHRSSFSNVENNDVARLLYVPYSNMIPFEPKSNVKAFALGSKTPADFHAEIAAGDFFDLNDGHFCLIPPNSSLLDERVKTNNYFMCPFCDTGFRGVKVFEEHKTGCRRLQRTGNQHTTKMLPNPTGATQKFKNFHTLSKSPFIIYADTETQTRADAHKLFSYFLYAKHETNPKLDLYLEDSAQSEDEVGDVMIEEFMKDLTLIRMHIRKHTNRFPKLDREETTLFQLQNEKVCCKFCGQVPIKKKTGEQDPESLVVHHDHNKPSPNIVGYLCRSCNTAESKINKSFACVFHNLPYDLLVLIKILAVKNFKLIIKGKEVNCSLKVPSSILARTSMKYASLTLKQETMICQTEDLETFDEWLPEIRFTDSFAFVDESLATIVGYMCSDSTNLKATFPNTWKHIEKVYPDIADELFAFSNQKGIIAYNHTTIESMESKTNLPKDLYKNDLDFTAEFYKNLEMNAPQQFIHLKAYRQRQEATLSEDYDRANKIFEVLRKHHCEEMTYREYFLFYQKLDVLLLSDFFEWFRNTLIPTHKLDPSWFMGLPSYSQNCMLYITGKQLHLIEENVDLSKLITGNLRGGLSVTMSKMAENFDKNPLKRIAGIDINNLYGYVMQLCKVANKFIGEIPLEQWKEEAKTFTPTGDFTYFLLCDVDASDPTLQDRVRQLPPLISKKNVNFSHLSKDQAKHKAENYRSEKLCCTLENQIDYLMHHQNYLFYTRLGYKITVKTVFKFEQDFIYRDYIELNSRLRQASTSEMHKVLYKLLNNIIYGKSLQRNDNRDDIEILSDPKLILKRMINPRLKRVDIIKNDELVMTNTTPREAKFDTAVQAGFTIVELSKLRIYSMLYDDIEPFCVENNVKFKLLYSDTDSLYLQYDFENSPFSTYNEYMLALNKATAIIDMHSFKDPLLHDASRKKQVGLFLDEEGDQKQIVSYVGLCSKSYCYITENLEGIRETVIKGKGVSGRYLKASYTFEDYVACSEGTIDENKLRLEFNNIQRSNYQNITKTINKVALSNFDDKMFHYRNEEGVWESLPHGHRKIAEIKAKNEKVEKQDIE